MAAGLTIGLVGLGGEASADLVAEIRRRAPGLRLIVDDDPGATGSPERLAAMAQGLTQAGADILAMADADAHTFLFEVERGVGVPVISLIEETGAAALALAGRGGVVTLEGEEDGLDLYRADFARRGLILAAEGGRTVRPIEALAAALADYARGVRPLPPPFASTEVGKA